MRSLAWYLGASLIVPGVLSAVANRSSNPGAIDRLRARVERHATLSNVDQRRYVGDFFALAGVCAEQGKIDEAISLYERGLRVDPWRLEYQLKLARLLSQAKRREEAVRKAKIVYDYAEQEKLIVAAEELLKELNAPPQEGVAGRRPKIDSDMEIVMVPIGPVNMRLLSELREALQQKLGIRLSLANYSLVPGPSDRNKTNGMMGGTFETFASEQMEVLRRLADGGFKNTSQYDADRLLVILEQTHKIVPRARIVGYLGVTEADIFAEDCNYLFGLAGRGHGLMSYHRYTAAFNETPPNRPKLLERSIKQAISSTFFILDIERCTSPICARAYPHDLAEHDQKSCDLCQECKQALAAVTAKHKAMVRR